jgi:hypothetical protein
VRVLKRFAVAVAVAGVLVPSAGAASAQAAARPLAALKVSAIQVETGAKFTATYSVGHIPLHSKVLLQRTFGTARAWKTEKVLIAKTLKAKYSGAIAVTAPVMGSYGYRVEVVSSKSKALVAAGRTVHVFGDVPLATILNVTTSTEQIGTSLFRYATYSSSEYGNRFLHFDSTTCRSATFAIAADAGGNGGSVSVVQETADPFTLPVGAGLTASGTVLLSGNAADFTLIDNRYNSYNRFTYANGTMNCWTPTGTIASN